MNDKPIDLDQTDEDTLTYEVSDEALEAAAGKSDRRPRLTDTGICMGPCGS
jgi:hypothetical protein